MTVVARELWKFEIPMGAGLTVDMPAEAEIVSVGTQSVHVMAWAIVDPKASLEPRRLGYFSTGAPIPDGWTYVGTAHVPDPDQLVLGSRSVWHVLEGG